MHDREDSEETTGAENTVLTLRPTAHHFQREEVITAMTDHEDEGAVVRSRWPRDNASPNQIENSQRLKNPASLALTMLFLFVVALLAGSALMNSNDKSCDEGSCKERPPSVQRVINIADCITRLSGTDEFFAEPDSPQMKALQWFAFEPAGRSIPVDGSCYWGSLFGTMYSLIVLRESVQIKDISWYSSASIMDLESVCQHWKRLKCDAEHDRIESIILNNAKLTGTLPTVELLGLAHSLNNLELYSNEGLQGTLPTELGTLTALEFLMLQETSLSGTIPSELGYLSNLREFFVDKTWLQGSVPSEICELEERGKLSQFHADCSSLECCSAVLL